jgi:hypothetical protein
MSRKSVWDAENIGLSLKVGAIVTVLGFVVFAAEHWANDVSPQEITAVAAAPSFAPTPAANADYFPSHFPEPTGDPQPLPSQF